MKLSIIVPVYNAEAYLGKCIESIQKQTFDDFELILVDDGSKDSSSSICDVYAQSDSRIKVIHQANKGVSSARNAGLDYSSGEYIAFVDSDDWIDDCMYEKLFEDINMHKADIACCNYFKENKPTLAHNVYGPTVKISNEDAMKYLLQGKIICGFIWNKVYSRNLLQDSRFDEDIFITQDVVFNVKIFNRAKIITYNEKQMYHYLYRAESASHGKFRVKKLTEISARERVLSIIKKSYPGLEEIAFSRYIETILRIGVSLAVSKTANRVLFEENQKLVINNKDRIFNSKVISRRFKRHAYFQLHSYAFCRKVYAVTTQGRRLNYFLLEKANTFLKTVGLN